MDILCTNHQPDGSATWPSDIPGRVYALEQPEGDIFTNDWTTHILLDDIRPNPSLPGAQSSRLAPGAATAIYPFAGNKHRPGLRPWIVVGGDEASKVWLMRPTRVDWVYDSTVIFDINEYYGPDASQTATDRGTTISTLGKVIATDSVGKKRDLVIYIPVFEAGDIHVVRLTNRCPDIRIGGGSAGCGGDEDEEDSGSDSSEEDERRGRKHNRKHRQLFTEL